MTKTLHLTYFTDPGHGWLRVPRSLLADLDIEDQISRYSYADSHGNAFLEEDCDMPRFLDAIERADGPRVEITDFHTNVTSPIRRLPAFPRRLPISE